MTEVYDLVEASYMSQTIFSNPFSTRNSFSPLSCRFSSQSFEVVFTQSDKFHWKIIWERKRIIISFVWKSSCKNLSRAFNNPFVSTRYRIYYVHPFFNLWTNKCSLNKFYYYRLLLIKIKNWRLLKNLSMERISTHLHPEIEKLNDNNHNENFFCKKMQSPAIKMIGKLKIIVFLHVYYFTL